MTSLVVCLIKRNHLIYIHFLKRIFDLYISGFTHNTAGLRLESSLEYNRLHINKDGFIESNSSVQRNIGNKL